MTNPRDIIEVVKELQEERFKQELDYKYDLLLKKHFPAIATALLLAVEALEKISHDDKVFIREGESGISASISNAMNQGHRLARDAAQSALSLIRNV